ncbi:MAG: hypothetical protein DRH57_06895 [Candidatus Cloacimonadota bacterium]|nr:MAG: hypothetical protein DRH57_06895 [Candidatus Cloacimonadota bacterium]
MPKKEDVSLKIYNIKGQLVRILIEEKLDAGKHSIIWNGQNDNGKEISSGIYFYQLKSGKENKINKMLLLR